MSTAIPTAIHVADGAAVVVVATGSEFLSRRRPLHRRDALTLLLTA